jgi:demethylmenaquinone methyltransferase / 2-methoxy-6-polyprenyl-1,4-benzoquinol methylase
VSEAPSKDPSQIQAMFHDISPRYDLVNGLMTGGRHHAWRRAAAREASKDLAGGGWALDACCGTGDFALAILREAPSARVAATDFTRGMLDVAKTKLGGAAVSLGRADTLRLPFRDGAFRTATVGWGIRNVTDTAAALRELARVLAPGGRLHILESGPPQGCIGRLGFTMLCRGVIPWLGRLITGTKHDAYSYYRDSVAAHLTAAQFADLMRANGFADVSLRSFAFGGVTLHSGRRG